MPGNANIIGHFLALERARATRPPIIELNPRIAAVFVALSVLILNFSIHLPVIPILVLFAMWLPQLIFKPGALLRPRLSMLAVFAMPALCLLSTLWSDYPALTLYLGTAFLIFALCLWIMAQTVDVRSLITGLVLGLTVSLLITLLNGKTVIDRGTGTEALIGLFGSKNMVGFMGELCIITTLALMAFTRPNRKRLMLLVPLALALYCLAASRSATAIASLAGTGLFAAIAVAAASSPRPWRLPLFASAMTLIVLAGFTFSTPEITTRALDGLGKKPTLTGRTYLWSEGIAVAQERPLLGHGYSAFWVEGQPQAERYWHEFYIAGRSGFHFHNSWIQSWVDLGYVGAGLLAILVITNLLLSIRQLLSLGVRADTLLFFSFSVMFLFRSFFEVDFFLGPFGVGVMLFYLITPMLQNAAKRR